MDYLIVPKIYYVLFSLRKREFKKGLSEEEMVSFALNDTRYFAKIYDYFHHKIFSYIYRRVGDFEVASDIASETFVKAFLNIKKFEQRNVAFSSWLYKIATNEINLYYRKNEVELRHVSIYTKTIDVLIEIESDFSLEEKITLLENAISRLNPDEIMLLEWRFYEELSFKEIAYLLDISDDNAKMRTYRVIDKIKKSFFNKNV